MADRVVAGASATAKVGGHPIHPMLIPFPIALFTAAFVSDLAFWATGTTFWAQASFWSIAAGLFMGALAAVAGFADFLGSPRIRALNDAWQHMIGNVIAVLLSVLNLVVRLVAGPVEAALPWGLVLSLLVVMLLLFTGWKGGSLVYRHAVAIDPLTPAERSHEGSLR